MSTGYEILSRTQSKLYNLTDETVLLTAGCMTDIIQLRKVTNISHNLPRLDYLPSSHIQDLQRPCVTYSRCSPRE